MGLLRDRKYAKVSSNLIEVNLSPILFARNNIEIMSLFIKGFFEVELIVNNSSLKKEKINNLGTSQVKGVSKDLSTKNSLIVVVTVNVNPFKWESFEYKLEVNGQEYDLMDG